LFYANAHRAQRYSRCCLGVGNPLLNKRHLLALWLTHRPGTSAGDIGRTNCPNDTAIRKILRAGAEFATAYPANAQLALPRSTGQVQAKEAVTSNSVGCRSQQGVAASVKPVSLANAMKAKRRAAIRRRLEHAWFLAVVLYALIRIFLADKFLAKYGLPIKPFALVEVVSSMVYALASARFVGALVDNHNRKAGFFGLCTLVGFGAPDVFVIVASDHIPRSIYVVLALIVLGTAVYTIRELRVKMRKARVQKQSVPGAEPAEPQ
jgi:hypothetical protein